MTLGPFNVPRATLRVGRVRRFLARFDWPLFLCLAVLCVAGLANLYSATYRTPKSFKFDQQLVWMLAGFGTFLVLTIVDYRNLHRLAWPALAVVTLTIVVVFLVKPIKGSQRWFDFGALRIQPSELAKIAVILALARLLHDRQNGELSPRRLGLALAGLAAPVLLIVFQPDLGTAILLTLIAGSVGMLLARKLWPILAGLGVIVLLVPLLASGMEGYQKKRIDCFIDPAADPKGYCWHTQQSILAVGSGRLTGKGYGNATQNLFNFVPEYWTDFPFSVWAEEWGFVGSVLLLAVFGFLILWCVNIAVSARDRFGTAICIGVAALLFWHVLINTAMVLGVAPVVGVTEPLLSYGGSSTLTVFMGLGLVSSVSLRRQGF